MTSDPGFRAVHVAHVAALRVAAPLAEAFPLFTPEGERRWVDDWAPEYLHPLTGECSQGTAFRTHHGNEETLWLVLEYQPAHGRAAYARITPGSRIGTVTIAAEAVDPGETWVTVRYELTSLSPSGNELLSALTEERYAAMIAEWERRVTRCLSEGPATGPGG